MDAHNAHSNPHFPPAGYNPFVARGDPSRFTNSQPLQSSAYSSSVRTTSPSPLHTFNDMDHRDNQRHEYPPATPPHLTHSRRGSRESTDTSSNSTPHSGGSGAHGGLPHRHTRGHASSSMTPPSPIATSRKRKAKKKGDDDEDGFSDDGDMDPVISQKVRREDAKKSRQDAEQKRRDQLKVSYDKLRTVVPGATEKTSKVLLVNHAMQHIMKLSQENIELRSNVGDLEQDNMDLRNLVGELRRKLLDAGVQVEEGDVVMTGISRAPERPVDKPTAPAVSVSVASSSRSSKSKTGENPSVRRKTHSRMGSNASNAAFVVPTSATASSYPAPLSASLHPSSLTNPPLYPPASPAKGTNVPPTLVVNTREPTSSSSYSAPYSASYPAPSPATSASSHSSNSAQRQSVYSPDVPHLNHLFYPSGSSATSSGVSLNVAHLNMDESSYMQQQQDSSGSERGKNSRTLQSSGPYSETNPYSSDSGSSGLQLRPATLSIPPNQTFHNPGLGLDMNQGGLEEGGSMVGYDMSSDTMGMSMGMMSSGGFMDFPGTDGSGMMYPHQDSSTGPYLDPSLSIDGSLHSTSYQDGHDLPPLPGNYNPPRLAFHHSPMNDRFAESDAFLPHSPSSPHSPHFNAGQQQMQYSTSSHQPRAPSHLHISTNAPSLTTGHNLSPQMLHVPPGLASPSNGSPLVAGTPHPQSDAGGSYSEPSRQQGDEAAYIMPGMMMGETSDEGYGEPQNSSGPDSSEGEPPRSWLPMAVPRVITNYFRSG